MRKLLVMILCLMMSLPLPALEEEPEPEAIASGDYTYVLLDDGTARIVGYSGSDKALEVPAALDGHALTAIGDGAFSDNTGLTQVALPDGLRTIGECTFYQCFALTQVALPDALTTIGECAFSECASLTLVVGRGSNAERYCEENGLNYTYPDAND